MLSRPPLRRLATVVTWALAVFSPAAVAAETLRSTSLPVSVVYDDPAHADVAKDALSAAEAEWTRLVVELGYPAPWTEDDMGKTVRGMVFRIASTGLGPGTATADWNKDLPETPRCDCSAYVTIDPVSRPDTDVREVVFHELLHTSQYASTCTDPPSAYENFAVAAQAKEFPGSTLVAGVVGQFQAFPEYPVDYWTMSMPCDGSEPCFPYQLGAALFPLFVVDRFEGGDPRALGKLFATFGGDGTTLISPPSPSCSVKHPAWLERVRDYVEAHGVTFAQAWSEFTVWRAITGEHDDGHHLANARSFPSVAVAASHALDRVAEEPIEGELKVHEHGTRYIELGDAASGDSLHVSVEGSARASWAANVLLWRTGQPVEVMPLVFDGPSGALTFVVPEGLTRALLAVSQLDDGEHLAEKRDYENARRFRYGLARPAETAAAAPPPPDSASASTTDPGGCDVASPSSGTSAWHLLAGAGAIAALRRRRAGVGCRARRRLVVSLPWDG